ncbi:MAG: hypothetical protein WCA19_02215 [Candidatus Acidiferrales bacterium]
MRITRRSHRELWDAAGDLPRFSRWFGIRVNAGKMEGFRAEAEKLYPHLTPRDREIAAAHLAATHPGFHDRATPGHHRRRRIALRIAIAIAALAVMLFGFLKLAHAEPSPAYNVVSLDQNLFSLRIYPPLFPQGIVNPSQFKFDASSNLFVNCAVGCGGGGGTSNVNLIQLNSVALGSPSAYGTSPGAVNVIGVNAFVTNAVAVTGTFFQSTQPVSCATAATCPVNASQVGTWTVQQGGAPWSVSGSGNFTVVQASGANLHVNCDSGCSSSAGFSDNTAFTAGSTAINIAGGWYSTSPTNCTSGNACAPQLTIDRKLFVQDFQGTSPWIVSASGGSFAVTGTFFQATQPVSCASAATCPVNASQVGTWMVQQGGAPWSVSQSGNWTNRILGNAGGILDAAGQNAASPANELLTGCQFNTTPTTISSGNMSPEQCGPGGALIVQYGSGAPFSCVVASTVTVTTQCEAAPGAGLRAYVTSASLTNAAATALKIDIVYGTGTNCATGTTALSTAYQFGTLATTTNSFVVSLSFPTPLVPVAANAICVRPSAATAFGATLTGFIAP